MMKLLPSAMGPVPASSTVRIVFLWLCSVVTVGGRSQVECPVTVPNCACTTTYTVNHHIYCEYLGYVNTLPDFGISNVTFVDLHVRYGSRIHTLANGSFRGVSMSRLYLSNLYIRDIEPRAFEDLELVLEELHLDTNLISSIPEEVFSLNTFTRLTYLGLHNNLLSQFPPTGRINIPNLSYISLFNNRLRNVASTAFQATQALYGINLNNNLLESLPPDVFYNLIYLRELELANNSIADLPTDIFRDLISLSRLDLSYNNLYFLHQETFIPLENLTYCLLSHNKLSSILSLIHTGARLRLLDLSHNKLLHVDTHAMDNMTKLETLDLSHNWIATIPPRAFENLISLRKLLLGYNMLVTMDHIAGYFSMLWYLDIAGNLFEQITNETFDGMINLRVLSLENNMISDIFPETFRQLQNLSTLDLSNNTMTKVHTSLFSNHSNLENLLLRNNTISLLEDGCFQNLSLLRRLDLENNELSSLPIYAFNGSTRLWTLKLSNNKIGKTQRMDRWYFEGLHSLKFLYLDHNEINEIPHRTFERISGSLTHLYLQHNRIRPLYWESFGELVNLLELNISNNLLVYMSDDAFRYFANLKVLDIHENQLSAIRWTMIDNLKSVEYVDLSFNSLSYIPDSYMQKWNDLITLKLFGNDLRCGSCNLACLRSLDIAVLADIKSINCTYPLSLNGWNVLCFPLPTCYCPPPSDSVLQFCTQTATRYPALSTTYESSSTTVLADVHRNHSTSSFEPESSVELSTVEYAQTHGVYAQSTKNDQLWSANVPDYDSSVTSSPYTPEYQASNSEVIYHVMTESVHGSSSHSSDQSSNGEFTTSSENVIHTSVSTTKSPSDEGAPLTSIHAIDFSEQVQEITSLQGETQDNSQETTPRTASAVTTSPSTENGVEARSHTVLDMTTPTAYLGRTFHVSEAIASPAPVSSVFGYGHSVRFPQAYTRHDYHNDLTPSSSTLSPVIEENASPVDSNDAEYEGDGIASTKPSVNSRISIVRSSEKGDDLTTYSTMLNSNDQPGANGTSGLSPASTKSSKHTTDGLDQTTPVTDYLQSNIIDNDTEEINENTTTERESYPTVSSIDASETDFNHDSITTHIADIGEIGDIVEENLGFTHIAIEGSTIAAAMANFSSENIHNNGTDDHFIINSTALPQVNSEKTTATHPVYYASTSDDLPVTGSLSTVPDVTVPSLDATDITEKALSADMLTSGLEDNTTAIGHYVSSFTTEREHLTAEQINVTDEAYWETSTVMEYQHDRDNELMTTSSTPAIHESDIEYTVMTIPDYITDEGMSGTAANNSPTAAAPTVSTMWAKTETTTIPTTYSVNEGEPSSARPPEDTNATRIHSIAP